MYSSIVDQRQGLRFAVSLAIIFVVQGFSAGVSQGLDNTPTVLGAVLDTPPLTVTLNGQQIRVYDGARNEALQSQGVLGWRKMTYYFDAPLTVAHDSQDRPKIGVFPSLLGTNDVIQFALQIVKVDRAQLARAVRESQRNPYAEDQQLQPLTFFKVEVRVPDLAPTIVDFDNGITLESPLTIQLTVPTGVGAGVVTQLQNGLAIRVRLLTLTKLTQLTQVRATWAHVTNTRVYQDYFGPAGPQFVTAAQAKRIITEITTELELFQWQEGSPETYRDIVKQLRDRLFDVQNRTELRLEEAANPTKLRVDIGQMQDQGDVIRRIATDAKNLNNDEWCRKYNRADRERRREENQISGGVDVVGLFGGDVNVSSRDDSEREGTISSDDCGKHLVENTFN